MYILRLGNIEISTDTLSIQYLNMTKYIGQQQQLLTAKYKYACACVTEHWNVFKIATVLKASAVECIYYYK